MNDMTVGAIVPTMNDDELIDVLVSSLYPGARRESAAMVLAYCRAAGLDPLQKPVHIVPMKVKLGTKDRHGNDEYGMRDVVMPGIGLYRTQAARTGVYAGQDEPELGPMRTLSYMRQKRRWVENGKKPDGSIRYKPEDDYVEESVTYPEWVSVTVYRLVGGFRVAFVAREYWLENYATAGGDSDAPNAMWARRTIGQLVKCAEAQALRKGFPEVGSQPTAEEMEGRDTPPAYIDSEPAEPATAAAPMPRRASATVAPALPDETTQQQMQAQQLAQLNQQPASVNVDTPAPQPTPAAAPAPAPQPQQASAPTGEPATEGERKNVQITAKARGINLGALLVENGCQGVDADTLDGLTKEQFRVLKKAMA